MNSRLTLKFRQKQKSPNELIAIVRAVFPISHCHVAQIAPTVNKLQQPAISNYNNQQRQLEPIGNSTNNTLHV